MYCNVLITKPFDHFFTYKIKVDQNVKIGNVVRVPFGKKKDQIGIVYELCSNKIDKDNSFTIKEIDLVYDEIFLNVTDSPFDQNRLYAALGYKFNPSVSLQAGYLRHRLGNQKLNRFQLGVFLNTKRKEKK